MQHSSHTFYKYVYGIFTATGGGYYSHSYPCLLQCNLPFCLWYLAWSLAKHHHLYNVFEQQHISLRYSSDEHDKIFDQSSLIDFFNYAPDKGYSSYVAQWKCTLK